MQIGRLPGIGMYQQQNQYFQNANRSLEAKAAQSRGKQGEAARTDTAVFNYRPQKTQGNSMLQSLMEQKENLMEQKRGLMKEAKAGGGSVKEQIDQLNQQLEQLDEQISQQMLADATRMDQNDVKKKEEDEPKTEEEAEAERVGELTKMSAGLNTAEVVASVQRKVASEARILQAEMNQDGMVGADGATMAEFDDAIEAMRAREAAAAGNTAPTAETPTPKPEAATVETPDTSRLEATAVETPKMEMARAPQVDAAKAEAPEKSSGAVQAQAPKAAVEAADADGAEQAETPRVRTPHAALSDSSPLAKSETKPKQLAELEGKAARLAGMVGGKLRDLTEEDEDDAPVQAERETGEPEEPVV